MKIKTTDWLVYGAAALSAILAVVFVYGYVQNRVEDVRAHAEVKTITVIEKPDLFSVVVAARDIYRGERIEVEDVKVLNVPTDGVVVSGVITNPAEAVGHVAYQKIYAGEWLIDQKVGVEKLEDKQSVVALLEKNRRAMRIPVGADTGLLGILNPGDHVDIVGVFESADSKRMVSRTILQNVLVLSIGQANRMKINQMSSENEVVNPEISVEESMIAVDVSPAEAEKLALAMNVGAMHLVLRNPSDTDLVETAGVSLKNIEKGKRRPPKYIPKQKREVIEVMQGGNIERVITR